MSRRTTPSSDEFRDDLDYDQLTFENELARERARQQRRREAGLQRGLSERLEGHTTPLSVGVGRSPLVTPTGVRDALQRAMDLSGVPTAPPAGVGVAPNVPLPTFSPRQIDVMERILRNVVPKDQIDALLDSVGLDNNQLADYIAQRPPSPPPPPPPPAPRGRGRPWPRGRGRGRGGVPPGGGGGDDDDDDDGSPPGGGDGGGGGGRRGRGRGRGRGTPPQRARINQDELRRQMDLLDEDARQRSVRRRIAGITHTNTITTVYKDGEPEVYRTSSRLSTPNTV